MTIEQVVSGEKRFYLEAGDCLDVLRAMPEACVDAIVCDPPAGIDFMSSASFDDSDKGGRDAWVAWLRERMAEALRVLKPGGYAFVWSIPQTSHWTGWALETAGFSISTTVLHIFGQGMPHGLNVGLAIDDVVGVEHETTGTRVLTGNAAQTTKEKGGTYGAGTDARGVPPKEVAVKEPGSPEGKAWSGWNTQLKPAVECWWVVQKPIAERTIARQVLATGTGALNVDACRVAFKNAADETESKAKNQHAAHGNGARENKIFDRIKADRTDYDAPGRYPANLVLSHGPSCELVGTRKVKAAPPWNDNRGPSPFTGAATSPVHHSDGDGTETVEDWTCDASCPVRLLDEQSGKLHATGAPNSTEKNYRKSGYGDFGVARKTQVYLDSGGASRYFNTFPADPFIYAAKASRADRERGLEHLPKNEQGRANEHNTVKSVFLMRHFVRLACRVGGVVLDLFCGSGSTGVACSAEGMRFIGIDIKKSHVRIARARIEGDAPLFNREASA